MKSVRWLCVIALILTGMIPWTQAAVVINELYYDHPGGDSQHEFLELYNNGMSAVDISGWTVEWAGTDFTYGTYTLPPNTIIQAGDYLLFGGDQVQIDFGVMPDIIALFTFQNGGTATDGVRIWDGSTYYDTNLYDSPNTNNLRGDDANPGLEFCPDVASGHSLERVTLGVDNNLASDWFDNASPTPSRSSSMPGNTPPEVSDAAFYPDIVSNIDEVLVTATAFDDYSLVSVNVQYQVNGGGYNPITMYDDGNHGDGAANDSVWGGSIPAQSVGANVELYVEATDDSALVTWDPILGPNAPLSYDVSDIPLSTIMGVKPVDGNGEPLYLDSLVMVVGLVEAATHYGYSGPAYIRDATGGIAVYGPTVTSRNIAIGDSVRVMGWINVYSGLVEIMENPVGGDPDPVFLISSSGNTVDPVVYTIPQLGEPIEGLSVRINGGHFTVGGNFAYTNYDYVVGTDTIDVRIDNDTDIIGTQIPPGDCDIVGCLGQYVFAPPYIGGYQMLPRMVEDIITFGNQPPAVGNTLRDPLQPTPDDSVWVTSDVTDDHGLTDVNLHYQVNSGGWFRTQVTMYDDGLHHDGAAGDDNYGAAIPPYLADDVIDYYVSATDDSSATTTDPAGAPGTTYSYTVSAGLTITLISYVRENDLNGEPVRMDSMFTVIGLVTADTAFGDRGPIFLQDGTGGIGLYDTEGLTGYGIAIGDSIRLTGWVGFSNGLTEIVDDPNNQFNNPVVVILNSGNTLNPVVLTIPQVGESNEGEFVVFNNVTFVETGVFGSSGLYHLVSGTDTLNMYVDYDTDIGGNAIPTGAVNVQGIMGQYDSSTPYFDDYQLLPRTIGDIGTSGGPVITPISYIRENDANGEPIRLDSVFTAKALVTSATELGSSGPAYMQDATAGIAFYDYTVTSSGIAIGDSIQITAWVGFYNGLTQFVDEPSTGTDPLITILSNGNTVTPTVVNIPSIGETTEGQLLQVNGGTFVETGVFASGSYHYVVGSDTLVIYIDSSTDIPDSTIPTGTIDIIGCAGQFDDFTPPYFEGYQLIPRMFTDILTSSLAAVDDLEIEKNGDDIVLRWSDVFGAADYKVYYCTTANGTYTVLAPSTSGASVYTHVGGAADPALQGFYYVTAVD